MARITISAAKMITTRAYFTPAPPTTRELEEGGCEFRIGLSLGFGMGIETSKQVHVHAGCRATYFPQRKHQLDISNDKPRSKISAFDGLKDTPMAYLTPCPGEVEDLNTQFRAVLL